MDCGQHHAYLQECLVCQVRQQGKIDYLTLCDAVNRAEKGLIDADLGGGLIKQRIARHGAGKSGGFRALLFFKSGERAIFAFGFLKSDKSNLTNDELAEFKKAAKLLLSFSQIQLDELAATGRLVEVGYENENL